MEPVLVSGLVIAGSVAVCRRIAGLCGKRARIRSDLARLDDLATTFRAIHHIGETTRAEIDRTAAEFEAAITRAAVSSRKEKRR